MAGATKRTCRALRGVARGRRAITPIVGDGAEAAAGEDVEAEIAASSGPFVSPFGKDRADEPDDRLAGLEDPVSGGGAGTALTSG